MKNLLLLSAFVLFAFRSAACTCDPAYSARGFCEVIHASQNLPMFCVVKGRVIDWHEYGAHIEILDNIYGQASHDTIIVWGDMGACCRPSFAGMAQILPDDTLVMALEQTDLCGNWIAPQMPDLEDTMDYVLQGCGAYFMRYHNGQVIGVFESDSFQVDTMEYTSFVSQVQNCITPTSIKKIDGNEGITVYPNPAGDVLQIAAATIIAEVKLYNSLGQCVYSEVHNNKHIAIDISKLPSGIYTLLVYDGLKKIMGRKKIVRQ